MPGLVRAVGAAVNLIANLYAVAQDAAAAVRALRRERMHSAFETIEHMRLAVFCYRKCFVVVVAASLALSHGSASVNYRLRKPGWPPENGLPTRHLMHLPLKFDTCKNRCTPE